MGDDVLQRGEGGDGGKERKVRPGSPLNTRSDASSARSCDVSASLLTTRVLSVHSWLETRLVYGVADELVLVM